MNDSERVAVWSMVDATACCRRTASGPRQLALCTKMDSAHVCMTLTSAGRAHGVARLARYAAAENMTCDGVSARTWMTSGRELRIRPQMRLKLVMETRTTFRRCCV